jgi:DHA1 family tetracycline resistance protein-like MFS transporter
MKVRPRSPLAIVMCIVFFDLLGFGLLIPVITQLLGNPASPAYILPAWMNQSQGVVLLGALTVVYPLGQFLANPVLGELSDMHGRKKILAYCLFGTALSYVLFAVGVHLKSLPLLFIGRFFDGVTGGNIAVAQAAIADVSKSEERAKNFGLIGAAYGLGFILGPYIGGKLSDPGLVSWFNASTPFWFAALLGAVNWILVLTIMPETLRKARVIGKVHLLQSFQHIRRSFQLPTMGTLLMTSFLFTSAFAIFTTYAAVYLLIRFKFHATETGDYFAYVGLWAAFAQVVVIRFVKRGTSEWKILRFAFPITGIIMMSFYGIYSLTALLLITPLFAMVNGLAQANLTGLVSRSVGDDVQGEVLGVSSSLQALAQVVPVALAGLLAFINPLAPILAAGILMLICAAVFWAYYRPSRLRTAAAAPVLGH